MLKLQPTAFASLLLREAKSIEHAHAIFACLRTQHQKLMIPEKAASKVLSINVAQSP